ncbi:MAG: hypothetical protein U0892_08615 [Pirellulales bacterium]
MKADDRLHYGGTPLKDNSATYAARDAFASSLGTVSPDVLAPLINPSLMGGPAWPDLRQAWRVIRRTSGIAIMSDGLADPFDDTDEPNCGFELEAIAETNDTLPTQLEASWLFDLVYGISQQCAHHGGVAEIVDDLGVVSLELPVGESLKALATENERVGVLLGVEADNIPRYIELPGGTALIMTATLILPSELEFIIANGQEGRTHLARRLAEAGIHHRSSLTRASLI